MNVVFQYTNISIKFLKKNTDKITLEQVEDLIKKAIYRISGQDVNVDLKKLEGKYKGFYRIRSGDIRIIFSIKFGLIHIVLVTEIDERKNIY